MKLKYYKSKSADLVYSLKKGDKCNEITIIHSHGGYCIHFPVGSKHDLENSNWVNAFGDIEISKKEAENAWLYEI
jgi:hypothetical protein